MTAVQSVPAIHESLHQSSVRQTLALAKRSLLGRIRQPAVLAPAFIFPLFFAALSSSTFSRVKDSPKFPDVDSFLQFGLAAAILQGVFFGATSGAADIAIDIEQGFWERLIASPVHRASIVLGRLTSSMVVGAAQAVIFVAIFSLFGVKVRSGPVGMLALAVSAALLALAVSSTMATFAISSGSPEVVQGAFPLVFMLMFLSSAFMPRALMSGWFGAIVKVNPVSHVVEGMRQFVLEANLQPEAFAKAWGIPLIWSALGLALSMRALRRRLAQS